jgi:elongation factor G
MRAPLGEEGGTVRRARPSAMRARRPGQIFGIGSHPDWPRWDRIEATIPEAGLAGLDAELRSLSQGLASFTAHYDHVAELSGRLADDVVKAAAG